MDNLFAYGTLMCEDIMGEVSGCCLPSTSAMVRGYSRHPVKGEHYPGLVPDKEGRVEGVIYRNLPNSAWERLDLFEGGMYVRQPVQIELDNGMTSPATTYVVRTEFLYRLETSGWDFTNFLCNGKESFQRDYRGYRQLYRDSAT